MDGDLSENADSGKGTPAKEAGAQPLLAGEEMERMCRQSVRQQGRFRRKRAYGPHLRLIVRAPDDSVT